MANAITWVEIPVKDFERAKKFYETILKTKIQPIPTPRGKWGSFPFEMGEVNGGAAIVEGKGYEPSTKGSLVYLSGGQDLSKPLSRVEEAGGKIILPKTENGGFGFIALFTDTEGNKIGFHSQK
ncbi:VOC family protein [Pedobacter sp. BS3]|uniref:VOC family protein n=1 Tax=Pedobacter sp. BS3 TaxID=2567937 RepID=UPI0011EDBC17|nr:VOC family protein [Pedobacter sp. BS3]TZF83954.1 VOC family protein [Pedobacter sp. BS3]